MKRLRDIVESWLGDRWNAGKLHSRLIRSHPIRYHSPLVQGPLFRGVAQHVHPAHFKDIQNWHSELAARNNPKASAYEQARGQKLHKQAQNTTWSGRSKSISYKKDLVHRLDKRLDYHDDQVQNGNGLHAGWLGDAIAKKIRPTKDKIDSTRKWAWQK